MYLFLTGLVCCCSVLELRHRFVVQTQQGRFVGGLFVGGWLCCPAQCVVLVPGSLHLCAQPLPPVQRNGSFSCPEERCVLGSSRRFSQSALFSCSVLEHGLANAGIDRNKEAEKCSDWGNRRLGRGGGSKPLTFNLSARVVSKKTKQNAPCPPIPLIQTKGRKTGYSREWEASQSCHSHA